MTHVILSYKCRDHDDQSAHLRHTYMVKRINTTNEVVNVHHVMAYDDEDAIDLACIVIGADGAQVWHQDRLVHEIAPFRLKRRPSDP